MLTTKELRFSFENKIDFHFPDLYCEAEDTLLITGISGKGKTTLLHLLGGLLRPQSGSVFIDDENITTLSSKKLDEFRGRHIGIVLQKSYFVEALSVLDNVVLASWLATGQKAVEKAVELLQQLDLGEQLHKLPSRLSIGQQQRVSIARALINEPKLILADEPTSSLDDINTEKVAFMLSELARKYHAALLIVTHDQRLKKHFNNQINL